MSFLRDFWNGAIKPNLIILIILALTLLAYLAICYQQAHADPMDTCALQRELAARGLYRGDIDCIYGAGTRDAVARFQRRHGLADDGVAGTDTLDALFGRPERAEPPSSDEYVPAKPPVDRRELAQCGDKIFVTGPKKKTEWWATIAAKAAWKTQVGDRYGNDFVMIENARDLHVKCKPACSTCTISMQCDVEGVPCRG